MLKLYFAKLFKEHLALKLIFGGLTFILVLREFYVYYFEKPTYTSVSKAKLGRSRNFMKRKETFIVDFDNYPDMTICATPSFNSDVLKDHGYHSTYLYGKGISDYSGNVLHGWVGNETSTVFENLTDAIVTIKSLKDCPITRVKFLKDGEEWLQVLDMELTRVMHPNGRCCKAVVPKNASLAIINTIIMVVHPYPKANPENVLGFQLFLSDRMSANSFHRKKFSIDGYPLIAETKDMGYSFFNLKVHEQRYLENSDVFRCKNYQNFGDYGQCLNKLYQSQSLTILNCSAPWLTSDEDLRCNVYLNLTSETGKRYETFLASIIDDRNEMKSQCLPPCVSHWYQVTKDGIDARTDRYGLVVQFDMEVEITDVNFNIGMMTLLTRLGGIIGVGKNLLWLIITALTCGIFVFNRVFRFK